MSQAYEVLSNAELRRSYDATGRVPDDKAYNAAQKQKPDGEDEYGYEGGSSSSGYQQRYSQRGYRFYSNYDEFAVKLAIGRARRVRSLSALKALLQDPNGRPVKVGLVGFYAAGDADSLKRLRFPYPFAGWSDPHQGAGFWWEDAIQTCLVSVGTTNLESELLKHFGITGATKLPVVAWVKKDAALSYDDVSMAGFVHETFVSWVYERLARERQDRQRRLPRREDLVDLGRQRQGDGGGEGARRHVRALDLPEPQVGGVARRGGGARARRRFAAGNHHD